MHVLALKMWAADPCKSKGPAVKRYLAALAAGVAVGLATSAGSAGAVTLQPVCKNEGGLTNDERWATKAPFYIRIGSRADSYIAAQAGSFGGYRLPSWQVPCVVANSVARTAMTAWQYWPRDTGNVRVTSIDALGRPYLGRFYCSGQSYKASGRTYETCSHTGVHVGTIVVQFVIVAVG